MEEQEKRRILCGRLSRIGWGVLVCFIAAQAFGAALIMIPGVRENIYLTMLVNDLALYGLGPLCLWLVIRGLPKGDSPGLVLSPRAFVRTALFSLGAGYLFNFVTLLLIFCVEQLTGRGTGNLLEQMVTSAPFWFTALTAGILAPVLEELIFRKLLLDRLRPFGDRCAIWVSAVAFGLFHMNLYQFFYAVALGLIFAGVALKTGKIWYTVVFHAFVNLFSLTVSELSELMAPDLSAELATAVNLAGGALVLALLGLTVYWFIRYAPTFRHAPPSYPVTEREVMTGLLRSPGLWVCFLVIMALSVAIIFLI